MAKRIIVSTVITLALAFSPSLAFSLPTKNVNKEESPPLPMPRKRRAEEANPPKSLITAVAGIPGAMSGEVMESSMVPHAGASVYETPPLMKVTPQRDGGFLLQPLEPKKNGATVEQAFLQYGSEPGPKLRAAGSPIQPV